MPLFYPPLDIEHNGTDIGPINTIDFTTGISVSESNMVATVSASGGGGSSSGTEVEINFGTIPTRSMTFTITDSNVTTSSKIIVVQSGGAPTGRSADENEMDPIIFSATPGNGQFILMANALNGPIVSNYKINYLLV